MTPPPDKKRAKTRSPGKSARSGVQQASRELHIPSRCNLVPTNLPEAQSPGKLQPEVVITTRSKKASADLSKEEEDLVTRLGEFRVTSTV